MDDLPKVFAIGEKLFTADKWPNLYRTWDEYGLVESFASDGEYCLVAELNGKIIGFIMGRLLDKCRSAWSYGYLEWIALEMKYKRSGIGSLLLDRLTDLCIEQGVRMMLADTEAQNHEVLTFFKRHGFGHQVKHIYLSRNLSYHPGYLGKKEGNKSGKDKIPKNS